MFLRCVILQSFKMTGQTAAGFCDNVYHVSFFASILNVYFTKPTTESETWPEKEQIANDLELKTCRK